MAAPKEEGQKKLEPFAEYLAHPDTPYDCWFHVGDPKKMTPEKIGGCKLTLMAHSVTFRRMLHESPLAEKGDIHITDIEPATFRHFLRFVNGHFEVTDLSLEESVALLCAAEKYFVEGLKTRLGKHIPSVINVDNVFLPITTLECSRKETLETAIKKIVQQETKQLVAKEEFLELNTVGLLYIVTQDCLQISEVELWRAVLAWAKHQAGTSIEKNSEVKAPDDLTLKTILTEPLKHIRFCTMESDNFVKEVAATDFLTDSEIASVIKVLGGRTDGFERSSRICYDTSPRGLFTSDKVIRSLNFPSNGFITVQSVSESYMYITTDNLAIDLIYARLRSTEHPLSHKIFPWKLTYQLKCTVTLSRITDYENDTSTDEPVKLDVDCVVTCGSYFSVSFGHKMKLLPKNKYKLVLKTSVPTVIYEHKKRGEVIECDYFRVSWDPNSSPATHCDILYYVPFRY